ncbi:hypothetical protein [Aliiroseovarius subalbicans]|uniref:hypothetical protein n=1 Tax=Aliiroseovarius subalbicans TaxID=2925840 RepID=UPI001F5769EC|nr:hypothetical protein [Aliiroseovarius subalbicans]MCI2399288.1 hypothetical protein [Aliiroseovarius subalbicans]
MTIKHRLKKLEDKQPTGGGDAVRFISWVGENGERVGHAIIVGSNLGWIERANDETEEAFRLRVYATNLTNEPRLER